jgi:thiamine-monophosphate kinase
LQYDRIPLSLAGIWVKENMPNLFQAHISGGDDYELLFTASPSKVTQIAEIASTTKTPITNIGKIIAGDSVHLLENDKEITLSNQGYVH